MNWQEMQKSWAQLSVLVQAQWPRLTRADLHDINGDRPALAEALKRAYGLQDGEVENGIAAFEKDCRRPGAVK